ncbi:hypothetical protein [Streptomyces spiramyceticus]|uniref:hypothetical protein n=1 Tax=Streptomyces spiramyceticus TaxID=299717 RepID=UPI00237BE50C|nr:hypothetical protein [Streptomyces spiramyceticus]
MSEHLSIWVSEAADGIKIRMGLSRDLIARLAGETGDDGTVVYGTRLTSSGPDYLIQSVELWRLPDDA